MAFDQLHADALAEAAQLRQALTEAEASYQAEIARLRDANANLIRNAEILADEVIHATAERDEANRQVMTCHLCDWPRPIDLDKHWHAAHIAARSLDAGYTTPGQTGGET